MTALDAQTVMFELTTPIGGFLQAATIGLLPAHLLSETPIETLADDPFSIQPVGSGPFVLTSWNADSATLVPASAALPASPAPARAARPRPTPDRAPASPVDVPAPTPRRRPPATDASPGAVDLAGASAGRRLGRRARAAAAAAPSSAGLPEPMSSTRMPGPRRRLPGRRSRRRIRAAARARRPAGPRPGQSPAPLPADDADGDRAQPAPGRPSSGCPRSATGCSRRSTASSSSAIAFGGAATRADSARSRRRRGPSTRRPTRSSGFDAQARRGGLQGRRLEEGRRGWAAPGSKKPFVMRAASRPTPTTNPTAMAVAEAVAADWRRSGSRRRSTGLPPGEFVEDRLRKGKFQSAAIDVNIGLDPDLYPLFALDPGRTRVARTSAGSRMSALDRALIKARAPGTLDAPQGRIQQAPDAAGRQELPAADRLP